MMDPNDLTTPISNDFMAKGLLKLQELYLAYHTSEVARKAIETGVNELGQLSTDDKIAAFRHYQAGTAAIKEALPLYEDLHQTIEANPQLRATYLTRVVNASGDMRRVAEAARDAAPQAVQAVEQVAPAVEANAPILEEGVQAVEGQAPGAWNAITQGVRNVGAWVAPAIGFLGGRNGRLALASVATAATAAGGALAAGEYGIPGVIGPGGAHLPGEPVPGADREDALFDSELDGEHLPGEPVPGAVPAGKKIVSVDMASSVQGSVLNGGSVLYTITYEGGAQRSATSGDRELNAYYEGLPGASPGFMVSLERKLDSIGSAISSALKPTVIRTTPDGKTQAIAAPAAAPGAAPDAVPKTPLVAKALESPGVPPAMSDTDMYGAPAPGATGTQLAGAKVARDATGAGWNAPITPDEQAQYRGDQEALFVKTMEARWKAGLDGLSAAGLGAKAAELGLARNALATRRASALATLGYLRPALQQAISRLSGQKATSAAMGSAEYQAWMQQQDPQTLSQYNATVEAFGKAQSAYDTATETYIAATLTPELLLSKPGEWSNIREVDHPSVPGAKVLGGIYTDGAGRQSFRYLGWDDNAGALTQAPAPDDTAPADPASGRRGGGGDAPVIIPGSGAGLAGIAAASGATPPTQAPLPPAVPSGAGPKLVTVGAAKAPAAPAAPAAFRERAYESKDDVAHGLRHTWDDAGTLVRSVPIPGWDVKDTYKHDKRVREDGAIVDLVTDLQGNVIGERVLTAPDPQKVEDARQARLTGEGQRVAAGNTQLTNQYTLERQAATDENTRNNEAFDNSRKDLKDKIDASTAERKRQVLDLVAQKKLTLPQALSILHDQQGLATAMATEQQKWEQQRAQRMAEKDKGLTYAQSLDKELDTGLAYLSANTSPGAQEKVKRYEAYVASLPGRPSDSVGMRMAQQRGYSGVAYDDPGVWQPPNTEVTPGALASMGVGADPTDAFYAAYRALEQPVMRTMPATPTLMPMPTGAPAAQVAPVPAAVGGWGAGLGQFGR